MSKEQLGSFKQNYFQSSYKTGRCSSSGQEEWRILNDNLEHLVGTPESLRLVIDLDIPGKGGGWVGMGVETFT